MFETYGERQVYLSAMEDYIEGTKKSIKYCGEHDLPDLKSMWEARLETAKVMRKNLPWAT